MIKYFTSEMDYKRDWWKEAGSLDAAFTAIQDEVWVWDADNCGTNIIHVAVDDGHDVKYYNLTHEWWVNTYDDDGPYIYNEFSVYETVAGIFNVPSVKRDWLLV